VWIERVCDWELNRRGGHDSELLPPGAAIDASEDAVSIDAAIAMRGTFAADSSAVRDFLDSGKAEFEKCECGGLWDCFGPTQEFD
jgi:hypothetical protein